MSFSHLRETTLDNKNLSFTIVQTQCYTYLIDENGIIAKAFGKVKPKDNAKQMLKEI